MAFRTALEQVYLSNPCQALPNPLWKTIARLEGCRTSSVYTNDGQVKNLQAWQADQLLLYWDVDRAQLAVPPGLLARLTFALLHQDFLGCLEPEQLSLRTGYFRLLFQGETQPAGLPGGFSFVPLDFSNEQAAKTAADLISRCYSDIHPTADALRGWMQHPVFVPDLWVWIWDVTNDRPAGLGIAELDASIGEGALEWIQVLPEYRGLGLASGLVRELLRRLQGRASFITVSGEVGNPSSPERLYRRCGFTGADVWWVCRSETRCAESS